MYCIVKQITCRPHSPISFPNNNNRGFAVLTLIRGSQLSIEMERKGYNFTLSQSFCSSIIAVGDSISGRILNACPSLMYAGPKEVTISLNSMALATSF